jgi:hypothetical protein
MAPKRRRKPSMPPTHEGSEHWHQSTFISLIRQVPHVAGRRTYATPNGFLRTKAMRIRAWQEGMVSGVWDVHVPVPSQKHPGMWIEFKAGNNTLSKEQREFGRDMEALGHKTVVAYSWREAFDAWCAYLGIRVELSA